MLMSEMMFMGKIQQRPLSKRLAANPVCSACALLHDGGVPRQVEMNDMAAVAMQIDAILPD